MGYSGPRFTTGYGEHFWTINAESFDRWLAAVKADAWDEGYEARLDENMHAATNPYRSQA